MSWFLGAGLFWLWLTRCLVRLDAAAAGWRDAGLNLQAAADWLTESFGTPWPVSGTRAQQKGQSGESRLTEGKRY